MTHERAGFLGYEVRGKPQVKLMWVEKRSEEIKDLPTVIREMGVNVRNKLRASGYEEDAAQAVSIFVQLEVKNVLDKQMPLFEKLWGELHG